MMILQISFILIFITLLSFTKGRNLPKQSVSIDNNKINEKDLNRYPEVSSEYFFNGIQNNFTKNEFNEILRNFMSENNFEIPIDNFNTIEQYLLSDVFLSTPQLLKKYGYPSETHTVQTPDGYILEMHRIPKPGAIPVYLNHGILDTSGSWVIMGRGNALAYILSDFGYDVWMGNNRGNRYSKQHSYLNPKSSKFWDFSFHELGVYDVPTMIDYIIENTGHSKIHYVGHSQGNTIFFVMCHLRPGYCDKIISMNALSPIAYVNNIRSPLIKLLSWFVNSLEFVSKIFGIKEILPSNDLMTMAGQVFCKENAITQSLCANLLFLITGYDSEQLNKTMLPVIFGHVPAGASSKQLLHFGQMMRSKKFCMYDYGMIKNWFIYGSISPPSYDLSKVTAPITLHYSMNDWMANPKDVFRLDKQLPNVFGRRLVPMAKFNHMDFIYAINAKHLLYDEVIQVMLKREQEEKLR